MAPAPDRSGAPTVVQLPQATPPREAADATAGGVFPAAATAILTAVRRQSQTLVWLPGALVLLNILAWWWMMQPAPVEPQAHAATGATVAAPALTLSAPTAAASTLATDNAGTETIPSILPARNANAVARSPDTTDTPLRASPPAVPAPNAPAAIPAPAVLSGAVLGPRERCGDRNFFSLLVCMKRECDQPALAAHPEYVKMRDQEAALRDRRQ